MEEIGSDTNAATYAREILAGKLLTSHQSTSLQGRPDLHLGGKCVCENVVRVMFSPVQRYPTRLFVDMSVRLRHGVASIAMITILVYLMTREWSQ